MSPFRSRNVQTLRYYLYISDTKLEMLFDQIDQSARKRISAELKLDLKVASLTLREADNPAPTRAAKLRIVERFIDMHQSVGTVEKPTGDYFRGQMEMQWGELTGSAVCFKGTDSAHSRGVLLVGSKYHVLGETSPKVMYSSSGLYSIMQALLTIAEHPGAEDVSPDSYMFTAWHYLSGDPTRGAAAKDARPGYYDTLPQLPVQRLDFLAIPLVEYELEYEGHHLNIVLGTPLYVARAPQ